MENIDSIRKNADCEISSSGVPDEADLAKISQYTRSTPDAESIYTFRVKLCDNEVDRDFEAFSADALKSLECLMKGRTGICDHNPKAENQIARVYDCRLVTDESRKTSFGQSYIYLTGFAYMPKTESTRELIAGIEAGIHKETSIGCSVKRRICSICGKDARACGHRKGEIYGGKLCYTILDGVSDAYEWSFVAIPAQREAGIMKKYEPDGLTVKSIAEGHFGKTHDGKAVELTFEEAKYLSDEISFLRAEAAESKKELENEVVRLSCMANSALSKHAMSAIAEKMELKELKALKHSLEFACRQRAALQIIPARDREKDGSCGYYKI